MCGQEIQICFAVFSCHRLAPVRRRRLELVCPALPLRALGCLLQRSVYFETIQKHTDTRSFSVPSCLPHKILWELSKSLSPLSFRRCWWAVGCRGEGQARVWGSQKPPGGTTPNSETWYFIFFKLCFSTSLLLLTNELCHFSPNESFHCSSPLPSPALDEFL